MSPNSIVQVYGQGLFRLEDPPQLRAQYLERLMASQFNTTMLFSVHVHPGGELYYGDTKLVSDGVFDEKLSYMKPLVAALKKKSEVWWSIGSAKAADFANIKQLLSTSQGVRILSANFAALLRAVPADGFDFDMEEDWGTDDGMRNAITKLTLLLHQFNVGVSFCPYTAMTDWFGCLADIYEKNGHQQIVKRLNLQCYDGGGDNTTKKWLDGLKSYPEDLGIPDIDSFIVPGYWVCSSHDDITGACLSQYSPNDICKVFSNPAFRRNAGGGFLWNTADIFNSGHSFGDYSQAIINGLADKC
jgi:hypothetical protein